jgi:hypothetical protein
MSTHAFTEILTFTRCANWNMNTCPHLKNTYMQMSIINSPKNWLLNDQTVDKLNKQCDGCKDFYLECLY